MRYFWEPTNGLLCQYTRAWDNTTPANTDNISAGAGEMRDHRVDIQERIDSFLSDDGAPSPPSTLANLDHRFDQEQDPLRINGDKVDLRGCTFRTATAVTSSSNLSTSSTSYTLVTGMTFTITPVSTASIIEFHFQAFGYAAATSHIGNNEALRGRIKIVRDPSGTPVDLAPIAMMPVHNGGINNSWSHVHLFATDTGQSAATTYEVQFSVATTASGLNMRLRGDITPMHFKYIEHV